MNHLQFALQKITGFSNFETASQRVLTFLHEQLGFQLWMITRTQGNDWIVLSACDHGYGVKSGDVFQWSDSFCYQMVQGFGPNIAPSSQAIPAYAKAPIGRQVPIGAYIGLPLYCPNGTLFGTLCAIDPQPQSHRLHTEKTMLELVASLLASLLHQELQAQENLRLREKAQAEAQLDGLTDLYNRRGWNDLLHAEEKRCLRYGLTACVLVIDLDNLKQVNDTLGHGAGDRLLQRAAHVIKSNVRLCDVVARLGGDEFAVMLVETFPEESEAVVQRIQHHLIKANILASIGWAMRSPTTTLKDALEQADRFMYARKRMAKAARSASTPS